MVNPKGKAPRPKKEKPETPLDRLKMDIARELGLESKVKELGWGGLTAAETGRVGGILTKRLKDMRLAAGGDPISLN